jgi:hypothetical protein
VKRVAIIVVVALLNAVVFGVTGSAEALRPNQQDKEAIRRQSLADYVRRIPPGAAVRVERLDGTKVEGIFDRVNDDGNLEMLQVSKNYRATVIIPFANVKGITMLRGRSMNSVAKRSGGVAAVEIALAALVVVVGYCGGLAKSSGG